MVGGTTADAVALSPHSCFVETSKLSAQIEHTLFVAFFVEASRKARSADGISIAFAFVSDRDAEIALGRLGGNESWRDSPLSGGIQELLTTLRESRL